MKIDLSDIITSEDKEVSKQATTELKFFKSKLGRFPIIKSTPFELTFTNEGNKRLLIHGKTEVTIAIPCGRCLEEVDRVFRIRIDKEFDLTGEDRERSMEESEFMAGTNLDVDQLIFGEILVSWPMKVLCREDCKGICKRCGTNLNLAECQCQKTELDPRMAAIQDIFNQFMEV